MFLGDEVMPPAPTDSTNQFTTLPYLEARKKNRLIFQALNHAIGQSSDKQAQDIMLKVMEEKQLDGVEAWKRIQEYHDTPTMQNKMASIIALHSLRQRDDQTSAEYKSELDKVFARIDALKVTLSEIKPIAYLVGLKPKYKSIVDAISISGRTVTAEDIFQEVNNYDQRETFQAQDQASARLASSSTVEVSYNEEREERKKRDKKSEKHLSEKAVANMIKKGLEKIQHKQVQVQQPPHPPTELTCWTCGGKGHRSSECPSNDSPYGPKGDKSG